MGFSPSEAWQLGTVVGKLAFLILEESMFVGRRGGAPREGP